MEAQSQVVKDSGIVDQVDDLESIFFAHYPRLVRLIARIIRDPGRSEELAVEAFLKYPIRLALDIDAQSAWLLRTGVRLGLDELRSKQRQERYARLIGFFQPIRTPEDLHLAREEQDRVRVVLDAIPRRDSELLLLRTEGLSYLELAEALKIHPASVGTILARAQKTFRKEYIKKYGTAD